ncbi:MAG: ArsB/NhaD family transporter [Chloroflexia bacterium]|nr:ArsB/NhaD family transporter [Chloroflexia bacterium]
MSEVAIATTIFIVSYAVIVSERLDRMTVALAGGSLMIAFGVIDQDQAITAIDWNTLALLTGMMILVNILKRTGVFRYAGWRTAILLGGNPWSLMAGFAIFTAVASALLDNVTTVLLMIPVTIAICEDLGLDARPYMITQVIASNIGGTATLIGDPPNILIGGATGLDFLAFLNNLGPVALVLTVLALIGFRFYYAPRLGEVTTEARRTLRDADARVHINDGRLLLRSLIVLTLTIVGFLLHGALHLEAGSVAMFGATLLLLLSQIEPHGVLAEVEWPTLFFFVGLFVLVGGIEEIGLLDRIAEEAVALTGGDPLWTALMLLWLGGVASAIIDNIPAVATLIPLTVAVARLIYPELAGLDAAEVASSAQMEPLWWALALGACLGGNGSMVGASANVVAVGIAERRDEPIGFWGFTRIGAPIALVSLLVSSLYLWLRYF